MSVFDEMQTFVKVVESGGITAAADRMNTVKSAVSRRLSELEARLGIQLLTRSTRRMSLTESGQRYYEQCVRILADIDDVEAAITSESAALKGRLRITAPVTFGVLHLASAISDFVNQHPNLQLEVELNDRQVDLVDEGFDLAVRIADLGDSNLIARHLTPVRMAVCASPDYLRTQGTPCTPTELAEHTFLHYSNRPDSSWRYRDARGKESSLRLKPGLVANNGSLLRELAIAGHGIVIAPTFIVYRALESGQLVALLEDCQWPRLNAFAVYPPTRHLSPRVRVFIDFLAQRYGERPYWDNCLKGL